MNAPLKLRPSRHLFARLGVTMIEAVVVMFIAAAALTAGANLYSDHLDNMAQTAAAQEIRRVGKAYGRYLEDQHAVLVPLVQANGGRMNIEVHELQPDYLPDEFQNSSPLGQQYVFSVRLVDASKLEGVVHTESISASYGISPSEALEVARLVGADAGYTGPVDPQAVISSYGQFTLDLADYGVNPGAGSIVYALALGEGTDPGRKYLHRNAMSDPELNRMNTALDMGANSIANVDGVAAQTVNAAVHVQSDLVQANDLAANQAVVTNSITSGGTIAAAGGIYTDDWFRSRGDGGWYSERWGGGWHMVDSTWIRAYGDRSVHTGGTMQAGQLTSTGNIYAANRIDAAGNISTGASVAAAGSVSGSYVGSTGDIWANGTIGSTTQINSQGGVWAAGTIQAGGLMYASGYAVEGTACHPGGLAQNGSSTLTCVNGVWKASGGNDIACTWHGWSTLDGDEGIEDDYRLHCEGGVLRAVWRVIDPAPY